jgi:hypothetical protein
MTSPGTIEHPPEGWVYETADGDVGLFFEGWIHDDCPAYDSDGPVLAPEETVLSRGFTGEGHNRRRADVVWYRCPCGATMRVLDTSWDPDIPDDCDECPYDPAGWAS